MVKIPPNPFTPSGSGQTVALGPTSKPRKPASKSNEHLQIKRGVQSMKTYPLTEDQLGNLAGISLLATICFTLGAASFGFGLNLQETIAFSQGTPSEVLGFWKAVRDCSIFAAIILGLIGIFFTWKGKSNLQRIKDATTFE